MVRPEEKEAKNRTLEDILLEKFEMLQLTRENRNDAVFDEISKSIEILLRAVPDAYGQLMQERREMDLELETELRNVEQKAIRAPDKIASDAILNKESYAVLWEYREVYEEVIIDIMQQHNLMPKRNVVLGGFSRQPTSDETEEEQLPEQAVVEQKKPHLSVKTQRQEKFEV